MKGSVYVLNGHAVVTYGDRTLDADHIEYDKETDDASLTGHLLVTGGENDESIHASHGTINVQTQVGRFYDVTGSVGLRQRPALGRRLWDSARYIPTAIRSCSAAGWW